MLKFNEVLQKTSRTVSALALILLSLAITTSSLVAIKENIQDLFPKKVKAHVICINCGDTEEPSEEMVDIKPEEKVEDKVEQKEILKNEDEVFDPNEIKSSGKKGSTKAKKVNPPKSDFSAANLVDPEKTKESE